MTQLTAGWPLAYQDFAAPQAAWTEVYWSPGELAYLAAESGGAAVPRLRALMRVGLSLVPPLLWGLAHASHRVGA